MKTKEAKVHIGSKGSTLDKKSAESITRCITNIFESASENRISEKNVSEALALFTKVVLVTYLEDGTTKLETENIELEVHEGHKLVKGILKKNNLLCKEG